MVERINACSQAGIKRSRVGSGKVEGGRQIPRQREPGGTALAAPAARWWA
jgi:hypothetical protein